MAIHPFGSAHFWWAGVQAFCWETSSTIHIKFRQANYPRLTRFVLNFKHVYSISKLEQLIELEGEIEAKFLTFTSFII